MTKESDILPLVAYYFPKAFGLCRQDFLWEIEKDLPAIQKP